MKWTDDYYETPFGGCRRLQVDMDGRFWECGGEVKSELALCQRPGRHPHDASPERQKDPAPARRARR